MNRLFLANDHKMLLAGLQEVLASESTFKIVGTANNGADTINRIKELRPDVVLLDIDMPLLNGLDCISDIIKESPKTKIIMLSMHQERSIIDQSIALGASGFIAKNADKEEVIHGIKEVLRGETFFSEDIVLIKQNKGLEIERPKVQSPLLEALSKREKEILRHIVIGYSNREIGEKLFISHRTVDTHRNNIMNKLDIHNIAGLIRFAMKNGLLAADEEQ